MSIISSCSSLWFLFAKTQASEWLWVLLGVWLYQLILLATDWQLAHYIRSKMISLLRGELIAWLAAHRGRHLLSAGLKLCFCDFAYTYT